MRLCPFAASFMNSSACPACFFGLSEAALALAFGSAMVAAGVTAALEREATAVDTASGAPAANPPARRTPRRGAAWVARVPR